MWGWTLSWVKWSMRTGPATVLTGKEYKEHHWLVVPPINLFGYLLSPYHYRLLYHADVCSYHSRDSRSVQQGLCRRLCLWPGRYSYQCRSGHYSFHVQRGGLLCKSLHWGQRGCYPGGKLRVYWEFLKNIPSIYPGGKLRIVWNFISDFALNKPSG